ncbi:MAG TPA: DMT family transporter [Telmatospirillum sp.]|nr:DMT family transporter [Telmatospirillum sp.]
MNAQIPLPSLAARDNPKVAIVMIIVSTVLFSILWSLVKMLAARYPIVEVSFFRSALAFIPVGVMVATNGGLPLLRTRKVSSHIWRSVIGVVSMMLGFLSYHLMPLADAVAISFTSPLLITALSVPLLGEKVGIHRWSAVVVGFVGVLLIIQPGGAMLNLGAITALTAAIASAFSMVTIRQLNRTDRPLTIVFYFTLYSTLFTAIPLPFVWVTPTLQDWGLLIVLGLTGGIGQYFMTRAYGLASAAVVSPFNYVSLLWAALFGWAIWGDVPALHVFVGSAVVVASGLFILFREIAKSRDPTPPAS